MSVPAHTSKWGFDFNVVPVPYYESWSAPGYFWESSGNTKLLDGWHRRFGSTSNRRDSRGVYPNTNYEREIIRGKPFSGEITQSGYGFTIRKSGHFMDTYEAWTDLISNDFPSTDNARNRAVTEALSKLNEQKVNVGVFLAEAVKSADTIAGYASDLFGIILAAKRGTLFRGYFGRQYGLNGIPGEYLRWKYGVQPLAKDLYNVYQAFTVQDFTKMSLNTYASATEEYSDNSDSQYWEARQHSVKYRARCGIYAKVESEFFATATQLGLSDPLTIGWELVPYSFVLDWAVPVGNFLIGLSARQGLVFDGGFVSVKRTGRVQGRRRLDRSYNGWTITGDANGLELSYERYVRETLGGIPLPALYAKNPFRTGNVMSAIALFHNLVKGR